MDLARRLYINGVSLISLSIMLGGGSVLLVAIIRRMGIGTGYNTDSDIAIAATLLFIACQFGLSITGWGREPCATIRMKRGPSSEPSTSTALF